MELLKRLEEQLSREQSFITDNGEIKKWVVINYAQNHSERLIELLIEDNVLKEKFFKQIKGHWIFDYNTFVSFMENKNYFNDSYTRYKNKIGLQIGNKYLKQLNEVSLVWPFKDCILEGGQTQEEQRRNEIFFNEILAQKEINQLFEPKVLTNGKRYTQNGVEKISELKRDENGTLRENLVIKGNNLLALHSIKKQFWGKVKLIYIDPPYNTGGNADTFQYNNGFKRSSWLTFMKNRLEAAKNFLTPDSSLIVAIDENEHVYLGVLLDELFPSHEKHCITIVHNPRGIIGRNFSYTHEYAYFVIPKGKKIVSDRKIEESNIDWRGLRDNGGESLRSDAKNCFYPIIVDKKTNQVIDFGDVCKDSFHPKVNIHKENIIEIYPIDKNGTERKWRYARQSVEEIRDLLKVKSVNSIYDIQIGKDFGMYRTVWSDKRYDANEYGTKLINSLVPNNTFSFPKSLWNVYDCISAVVGNDKDALILDFHAGSGTTAHAVLELNKQDGGNRRFILVEQMDYVESVTAKRIQKVIQNNAKDAKDTLFAKEQRNENFIYFELKKNNQNFIEQIQSADSSQKLLSIWEDMKVKSFLDYNLDLKKHDAEIEEFKKLTLKQQKKHLCELLDKNQMYVNLSSIDDQDFAVSKEDKELTREFYQK